MLQQKNPGFGYLTYLLFKTICPYRLTWFKAVLYTGMKNKFPYNSKKTSSDKKRLIELTFSYLSSCHRLLEWAPFYLESIQSNGCRGITGPDSFPDSW